MTLFADSTFHFFPPLPVAALIVVFAVMLLAAGMVRWWQGPANTVARRWSLWILRGAILATVLIVLLNPTQVLETAGPIERPEIFYLLDSSASMQMGSPRSRWEEGLALLRGAESQATSAASVKAFRFGHRLTAIEDAAELGIGQIGAAASSDKVREGSSAFRPADGDTRLAGALRQVSSRFGRTAPHGIVLVSDGRASDEEGLGQVAQQFARLKVPIHVVPLGDVQHDGDVAIAAVIAPPRVRKFTEVSVQAFVRSFGFPGERRNVELLELLEGGRVGRKLASLPITLESGYQSVSLSFRTDLSTRRLRIAIAPIAGEMSETNNHLDAEMAIDRTKIRVLYIEGSSQPFTSSLVGNSPQLRGPHSDFKQALLEDDDIECVVLVAPRGAGELQRVVEYGGVDGVRAFPGTSAELSAFDAIVLSNVAAENFSEVQLAWIEQWISLRGGGLAMIGGERSYASGGWQRTPLAAMLPVELSDEGLDWSADQPLRTVADPASLAHPIWQFVTDDRQNREIAGAIPQVLGSNRWRAVKPNLATVLATRTDSTASPAATGSELSAPSSAPATSAASESSATIVAGRYGRGRTLALAFAITSPYADELTKKWGAGDNRHYGRLCRNMVYWLTESSSIGRRRLVASTDKRFYRPGESITLEATAFDEGAAPTKSYRVAAMIEPQMSLADLASDNSPLKWPKGLARASGERGRYVVWGEEFDLPLAERDTPVHALELPLAELITSGAASQSMRIELTAYEDFSQIDSTSIDVQVLHDPFEQQNPFPNHALLAELAEKSGGRVLRTSAEFADLLNQLPATAGQSVVERRPLWSNVWVLVLLLGLLTTEWCWRRYLGLA